MSQLIKRGTLTNSGARPINYGSLTVDKTAGGNPVDEPRLGVRPEETKIPEEIKAKAYQEAMERAKEDVTALLEAKTAELEAELSRELEKVNKEYEIKLKKLTEMVLAIESQRKDYITNLEPMVVALTMHALYKLTGKKDIFAELVKDVIAHAIKDLESNGAAIVKLSAHDKQYLSSIEALMEESHINIVFEDSLPAGSCMIFSDNTTIDASFSGVLESIQAALISQLPNS